MTSRILTKEQVWAADDTSRLEFVPCPEWGYVPAPEGTDPGLVCDEKGHEGVLLEPYEDAEGKPRKRKVAMGVNCRALSVKERGVARKTATVETKDSQGNPVTRTDMEQMECLMVTMCSVDDDGRPIFNKIDYEKLLEKAGGPVNRIARKAMQMSGMLLDDEDLGN